MAACKSNIDPNGVVHIASANLPITCKLQNPPKGVSIDEVEYFPQGGQNATPLTVTTGQSFSIPKLPSGTTIDLYVHINGQYPFGTTIYVVEDCDNQSMILAIIDRKAKFAHALVEVA